MAKYIDKTKLPQFLYFNSCCDEYSSWDISSDEKYINYPLEDKDFGRVGSVGVEKLSKIDFTAPMKDLNELTEDCPNEVVEHLYKKWGPELPDREEYELINIAGSLLRALCKDERQRLIFEEYINSYHKDLMGADPRNRKVLLHKFLSQLHSIFLLSDELRFAQGFPVQITDGEMSLPKMLLIEDVLYKQSLSENKTLDYDFLRNKLYGRAFVCNINGESGVKKMTFTVRNQQKFVTISMIDPINGYTRAYLIKTDMLVTNNYDCYPRGDHNCDGKNHKICSLQCDSGKNTCKHQMLNILASILYCVQEYLKTEKSRPSISSATTSSATPVKSFVPKDMIRMYDIKLSKEEKERFNKYAHYSKDSAGRYSTEKCPHTRRGTWRFNKKTGKKDIPVRASIVHKDRYEGFVSADRICK